MTNDDAVKIIKAGGWGYPENMVTEANMMAIEALEKQIPKKIGIQREEGYDFDEYYCPNCHGYFEDFMPEYDDSPSFCRGCGQALDWSEVE